MLPVHTRSHPCFIYSRDIDLPLPQGSTPAVSTFASEFIKRKKSGAGGDGGGWDQPKAKGRKAKAKGAR